MVRIKINYFSILRELTETHEEYLEAGTTVRSALERLFDKYGDKMRKLLMKEPEIPHESAIIALNGKSIKFIR